jgi:uncharacterized membrane protein YuzA (DUF378 family)
MVWIGAMVVFAFDLVGEIVGGGDGFGRIFFARL